MASPETRVQDHSRLASAEDGLPEVEDLCARRVLGTRVSASTAKMWGWFAS